MITKKPHNVLLLITITFCFLFCTSSAYAKENWPSMPKTVSPSIIVMDTTTSSVLLGKDIDKKLYPASITKVLTTIYAIEHSPKDLKNTVTISKKSIDFNNNNGGQYLPGVKENSKLSMDSALKAVMLRSANEVAWSVGESIAGSNDKFCDLLNERAKEIGCKKTHFTNPNGLFQKNHYTSVYDMALISSLAINNESFRQIIKHKSALIPEAKCHVMSNHRLFENPKTKWCIGGKTGYTTESRHSLVTYAKKGKKNLVCVVMNSPSPQDAADDTKKTLEYCFSKFKCINIAEKENLNLQDTFKKNTLDYSNNIVDYSDKVYVEKDKTICIPKKAKYSDVKKELNFDKDISLKVGKNIIGQVKFSYKDKKIASCDIILEYPNHNYAPFALLEKLNSNISDRFLRGANLKTIVTISSLIIIILIGVFVYLYKNNLIDDRFFAVRIVNNKYFSKKSIKNITNIKTIKNKLLSSKTITKIKNLNKFKDRNDKA